MPFKYISLRAISLFALLTISLNAVALTQADFIPITDEDRALLDEQGAHIIILAGQSNMVGNRENTEGVINIVSEDADDPRLDNVFQYGFDGEQLYKVRGINALDFADGTNEKEVQGIWKTFIFRAKALGLLNKPVILVPIARSGSFFNQSWSVGDSHFQRAVERIKAARGEGDNGRDFMAFLWAQGESSARLGGDHSSRHLENLSDLLVLQELAGIPVGTPFIAPLLNEKTYNPQTTVSPQVQEYIDLGVPQDTHASGFNKIPDINAAITEFVNDVLPPNSAATVNVSGLTLVDNVHYDAPSALILGERYADVLSLVLTGAPDTTSPIIQFSQGSNITHVINTPYIDQGVSASDNIDGDLTSVIDVTGEVDSNTVGTYVLRYRVTDSAGNTTERSRTVTVIEQAFLQFDDIGYVDIPEWRADGDFSVTYSFEADMGSTGISVTLSSANDPNHFIALVNGAVRININGTVYDLPVNYVKGDTIDLHLTRTGSNVYLTANGESASFTAEGAFIINNISGFNHNRAYGYAGKIGGELKLNDSSGGDDRRYDFSQRSGNQLPDTLNGHDATLIGFVSGGFPEGFPVAQCEPLHSTAKAQGFQFDGVGYIDFDEWSAEGDFSVSYQFSVDDRNIYVPIASTKSPYNFIAVVNGKVRVSVDRAGQFLEYPIALSAGDMVHIDLQRVGDQLTLVVNDLEPTSITATGTFKLNNFSGFNTDRSFPYTGRIRGQVILDDHLGGDLRVYDFDQYNANNELINIAHEDSQNGRFVGFTSGDFLLEPLAFNGSAYVDIPHWRADGDFSLSYMMIAGQNDVEVSLGTVDSTRHFIGLVNGIVRASIHDSVIELPLDYMAGDRIFINLTRVDSTVTLTANDQYICGSATGEFVINNISGFNHDRRFPFTGSLLGGLILQEADGDHRVYDFNQQDGSTLLETENGINATWINVDQ